MKTDLETGRFILKTMSMTVDPGASGTIDAANDRAVIDVSDLTSITVFVNQVIDAGTCTLLVEKSADGVNWAPLGTVGETGSVVGQTKLFRAGNNDAVDFPIGDANGMPLSTKQVRVTATALAGGGTYSFTVCGNQRDGYR